MQLIEALGLCLDAAMRPLLALAAAALVLAGCGGSSSAANVSYTLTPRYGGKNITVQISGPPAATRLALQKFNAEGGFVPAPQVAGPKDCAIPARGGKVTIAVYGSNPNAQPFCSELRLYVKQ